MPSAHSSPVHTQFELDDALDGLVARLTDQIRLPDDMAFNECSMTRSMIHPAANLHDIIRHHPNDDRLMLGTASDAYQTLSPSPGRTQSKTPNTPNLERSEKFAQPTASTFSRIRETNVGFGMTPTSGLKASASLAFLPRRHGKRDGWDHTMTLPLTGQEVGWLPQRPSTPTGPQAKRSSWCRYGRRDALNLHVCRADFVVQVAAPSGMIWPDPAAQRRAERRKKKAARRQTLVSGDS